MPTITIDTYSDRQAAERGLKRLIRAQHQIDRVLERIYNEPVYPTPEECYGIERAGNEYRVVLDDPSIPVREAAHA